MRGTQEYHSFKVSFASFQLKSGKTVGVDNAIFLQDIAYWCDYNRSSGINFFDGKFWTYGTMEKICSRHPYWTTKQIRRIINNCKELGFLIVGNYNKSSYDRTLWYSVSDEVLAFLGLPTWESPEDCLEESNCPNGQIENHERAVESVHMGRPIPNTVDIYKRHIDKTYIMHTDGEVSEPGKEQTVDESVEKQETVEPPVVSMPLKDGSDYNITASEIKELMELYPTVDIITELKKMKRWTLADNRRRKTRRGILKSINYWLSNAETRGSVVAKTSDDDRTHKKSFYELALEMEAEKTHDGN